MNPRDPGTRPSRLRRRNHGKSHSYYLTDAAGVERKLDGVTTLLGEGLAKPALVNWAGNTTAEYAIDHWDELGAQTISERLATLKGARFADRDAAAARGTQVHELAERIIHGEQVDVPDELAGHVESAVRWIDEWSIAPLLTETVVCSEQHGYAGTLDMVVTSPRVPGVWLADYKTSRSGIFNEAALQLAAYAHAETYVDPDGAEQPIKGLGITGAWGVWIRADGYSVYELDISDRTFETFRYIATVARRARAMKDQPLVGAELDLAALA